jgi:hypothetical protein
MYITECPFSAFENFEILPLETLLSPPPGETNGGVVRLRIVLSPEEASHIGKTIPLWVVLNRNVFTGRSC